MNRVELANQAEYQDLLEQVAGLLTEARQQAVRTVNLRVQTYWQISRRIVEEQGGSERAGYKEGLLSQLSKDLTQRFGRGFSVDNLKTMRQFYLRFPPLPISMTVSRKSQTSDTQNLGLPELPLNWSHYALMVRRVKSAQALEFYHAEALRGGWSVYELTCQKQSKLFLRLQCRVAFEHFLARVSQQVSERLILKGRNVLELGMGGRTRATVDLDFTASRNLMICCPLLV